MIMFPSYRFRSGFTLIELVITIVVAGVVSSSVALALRAPLSFFGSGRDQSDLVYRADLITQRLTLELQNTVSASVRTTTSGSSSALEYLHALDVRRYHGTGEDSGSTALSISSTTTSFDIWGGFSSNATSSSYTSNYQSLSFVVANTLMASIGGNTTLSVYSSGNQTTGTTAGRLESMSSSVITPKTTTASNAVWVFGTDASQYPNDAKLTFNYALDGASNPTFPTGTPVYNQWVYVTDGPVSYVCDMTSSPGSLIRYSGYEIRATQPILSTDFANGGGSAYQWRSDAPIVRSVLSDKVSACAVYYSNKVITFDITLTVNNTSMRIINQVYGSQ